MFDLNIALQTLIALAVFLALLFFFLLGYTYWTRKKRAYWQAYEKKFRDYYFSLILDYTEQSAMHGEADEIIKNITRRTKDYSFFLKLLTELDEILDGDERDRLSHFIEHPLFAAFYKKKLFETSNNSKIYACIYFQNTGNIDNRTLAKLIKTSKSSNLKLAYSATKALQSATDFSTRKSALLRFFKRQDTSELMVVELLHLFDSKITNKRSQITNLLKDLLIKDIDTVAKSIAVRYIGYQKIYSCSNFLFQYLKRLQYSNAKATLIRSLILVLGQLQELQAVFLIRNYLSLKEIDTLTHLAAVQALSQIGGEKNLVFLIKHLIDAEFPVRKMIIYELALGNDKRVALLEQFIIANRHFIKQLQSQGSLTQQKKNAIEKIKQITVGIHIALSQRQPEAYA